MKKFDKAVLVWYKILLYYFRVFSLLFAFVTTIALAFVLTDMFFGPWDSHFLSIPFIVFMYFISALIWFSSGFFLRIVKEKLKNH